MPTAVRLMTDSDVKARMKEQHNNEFDLDDNNSNRSSDGSNTTITATTMVTTTNYNRCSCVKCKQRAHRNTFKDRGDFLPPAPKTKEESEISCNE